ncbi:MAG: cell division protein FtsQ/DivIB, partial [Candidatus Omnitrophica bacterium]|nr:cell division protein FtsQ/DivIB [Candidatus Omnitrophota bacterium]
KKVVVIQVNGSFFNEDERVFKKMYLNKNIFVVDPEQVRILAKKRLSHLKKIEVKRLLPDTLEIEIVSREPVAVLDTSGGIVIDSEGIVLAVGDVPENLPKIKGLSFFFGRPEKGEKIEKSSLDKGLVLIRGLKNKLQKKHMKLIDYVDISDKRNTIIVFGDVVIKMGEDRFSLKIEALKEILADPNVKLKDIGYIDLRFSEAVISVK